MTDIKAKALDGLLIKHSTQDYASKQQSAKSLFDWQKQALTPEEWVRNLSYGYTIQVSEFQLDNETRKYTHAKDNWQSTYMIFADGDNFTTEKDATETAIEPWDTDNGLSERFPNLRSKAFAITQSVSSMTGTKPHKRYRLIFLFDSPITSEEDYHTALLNLSDEFPIIPCVERSPAQPVFGNARSDTGKPAILGNVLKLEDYLIPRSENVAVQENKNPNSPVEDITLDDWITKHNVPTLKVRSKGGYYVQCPWQSTHASGQNGDKDSYIWENPDGSFAFYCSHATCKQNGRNSWESYRQKVAPKCSSSSFSSAPAPVDSGKPESVSLANVQVMTANKLQQTDFPPLKWVVDDLIPEGLTLLAGAPKIGKSFMCWNIALAVAQQGIVFGQYPVSKEQSVLYLSVDGDPLRQIKNRLEMIQPDIPLPHNLYICDDFPISHSILGLESWRKLIETYDADLIIVDTMLQFKPADLEGTSYEKDYSWLRPVRTMLHEMDVSMIAVTHTRKMIDLDDPFNEIQGSKGMQAGTDNNIVFTVRDGDKIFRIKGREIVETDLVLTFDNGTFTSHSPDEVMESRLSDIRSDILNTVRDAGIDGITATDLVGALSEHTPANVKNTMRRMVTDGQIYQPKKRGRYFYDNPDGNPLVDDIPL